tara:strand:+ start:8374 stop:8487 length:114 start_codon:yes stop_codon:yes gene_type:complete
MQGFLSGKIEYNFGNVIFIKKKRGFYTPLKNQWLIDD